MFQEVNKLASVMQEDLWSQCLCFVFMFCVCVCVCVLCFMFVLPEVNKVANSHAQEPLLTM